MAKNIKKGEEMVLFKHTKKSQECDHFQMAKKNPPVSCYDWDFFWGVIFSLNLHGTLTPKILFEVLGFTTII